MRDEGYTYEVRLDPEEAGFVCYLRFLLLGVRRMPVSPPVGKWAERAV